MAMSFLVGTKSKSVNYIEPIVYAADPDAKEGNPAYTPVDEYYTSKQYISMNHIGNIEKVWDHYKGDDVRVAVIDSGFDYDHPDFINESGESVFSINEGRFFAHATYEGTVGHYSLSVDSTDKTSGIVQFAPQASTSGYTFNDVYYPGADCLRPMAGYAKYTKHGTDVVSTLASQSHDSTKTGCIGIAPNVKVIPIKTDFWTDSIYHALNYIYLLNQNASTFIDVVNMSIEATKYDYVDSEIDRIIKQGTIVIAAAGNSKTATASYPASSPGAIGVGALDKNSGTTRASYSNYNASTATSSGNNNVDLSAPGSVYTASWNSSSGHIYDETSGTSFASPIVAGAAALWKQANPSGTPDQFKEALFGSCIDIGSSGWDTTFGYGRLAIDKLLNLGTDVTDVVIDSDYSIEVEVGKTSQILAHVLPLSATDKDIDYDLHYKNGSCSVSSTGLVTGLSTGNEMVYVYSHQTHDIAAIVYVKVVPSTDIAVTGVSLSPKTSTISLSDMETVQLTVTVSPSNATNKYYILESDDETVATVSDEGLVTPVSVGTANIIVLTDDGNFEDTASITVVENVEPTPVVSGVTISPADGQCNVDLYNNPTIQLTATVNGTDLTDTSVTWSSANTNYGTVSNNGLVTGKKTGYVDIIATSNQDKTKKATRRVYISDSTPKVTSISLDITAKTLYLSTSDTVTLTPTVVTTNGGSTAVSWETSNSSVASVNSGFVTPLSVGTTTITARSVLDNTKTATCQITVMDKKSTDKKYFITAKSGGKIYYLASDATITSGKGSIAEFVEGITDQNEEKAWTFVPHETVDNAYYIYNGSKYLYISSNGNTALATSSTKQGYFTMSTDNLMSTRLNYSSYSRCIALYNTTDFRTYLNTTSNGVQLLSLYEASNKTLERIEATYNENFIKLGQDIDKTKFSVTAFYDDGSFDSVTNFDVTGYNKTQEGNQELTISYGGTSTTLTVNVKYIPVEFIEISGQKTEYDVDGTFEKPTVTAVYEDNTSNDVTNKCTFSGYNLSTAGAYNVLVSYSEHNITKTTSYGIIVKASGTSSKTGRINFNSNATKIDSSSVTGKDDLNNTWTVTTVGTTSFTQNNDYYQVGSKNSPASSITFTMSLSSSTKFTSVSFKAGGFSSTAGSISIKVGDSTIGTGSLNGTNDVTVSSTSSANGTSLTITITGISKGVKIYYISYDIGEDVEPTNLEKAQQFAVKFSNCVTCFGGSKAPVIGGGETWSSLTTEFNGLSVEVKAYFQVATPEDSAILDATLKHDQLVARYSYADFMGRTSINGLIKQNTLINLNVNETSLIVIAFILGVAAIGGYIFIRKRKES